MRRLLVVAGLLVGLMLVAAVAPTSPDAKAANGIKVLAKSGWQQTSLYVGKGTKYKVRYDAGDWTVDYRNFDYVGPQGYPPSTDSQIYQGCKLNSNWPYARLLGKVGKNGPLFSVGGKSFSNRGDVRTYTARKKGVLYLRIHDANSCLGDNGGSISVSVAKKRAGVKIRLPLERIWREPDSAAYKNHCGPGATQVALDARLPAAQVPSIDTLAKQENTNTKGAGTYMADIVPVLNKHLNTNWYKRANAKDQKAFEDGLLRNLKSGYAVVTGLKTRDMPGWGKYDAPHIVAVVGFHKKADGTKYVSYVDTAGTASGYKGTNAVQKVPLSNFWSYVDRNNVQAWG